MLLSLFAAIKAKVSKLKFFIIKRRSLAHAFFHLLIVSRIRSVSCLLLKKRISRKTAVLAIFPPPSLTRSSITGNIRFVSHDLAWKIESQAIMNCAFLSKNINASHEYYIISCKPKRLFVQAIDARFTTLPTWKGLRIVCRSLLALSRLYIYISWKDVSRSR